jgi:hypothetical protein
LVVEVKGESAIEEEIATELLACDIACDLDAVMLSFARVVSDPSKRLTCSRAAPKRKPPRSILSLQRNKS